MNNDDLMWTYYQYKTSNKTPNDRLERVVKQFENTGTAIDLGCGSGIDTVRLAELGWNVYAVDKVSTGFNNIRNKLDDYHCSLVRFVQMDFRTMDMPTVDFFYSSYALSFCGQEYFEEFWRKVVTSIKSEGLFYGNFFKQEGLMCQNNDMMFFEKNQVLNLFTEFKIELFEEKNAPDKAVFHNQKLSPTFEVVAKRL